MKPLSDAEREQLQEICITIGMRVRQDNKPRHLQVSTSISFTEQDVHTIARKLLAQDAEIERLKENIKGMTGLIGPG